MVTRDSHPLTNEPDLRESDTDSHNPICESTNTAPYEKRNTMSHKDLKTARNHVVAQQLESDFATQHTPGECRPKPPVDM